jgi:hypothetical protein
VVHLLHATVVLHMRLELLLMVLRSGCGVMVVLMGRLLVSLLLLLLMVMNMM